MDEQLAAVVGQRVRRLRLQAGNSLRKQAQLVGVAPSALSALENCRGGMSLTALQRVSSHFGLSITELLAPPSPASESTNHNEPAQLEFFRSALSGTPSMQVGRWRNLQLLGPASGHDLQPYISTFMPGGAQDTEAVGHPGEEFVYVLAGEVELLYGKDVYRLSQGDAVRFRTEPPHICRNASASGVAVIIGASTPPW